VQLTRSLRSKSAGFTLTELLIALLVLGVLMGLGVPSFFEMLRNAQMRSAAEGVANGLQRARAEAVSRNTKVYFTLLPDTSWTVDYVTKPVSTDPAIDSRSSLEGSPNAQAVAIASDASAATTVTFNQLGQVVANADASKSIVQVDFAIDGANRPLRVLVGAGGSTRVCDPALGAPNPRAC
jgi:type IV fimbrial biogenesis protein FimT